MSARPFGAGTVGVATIGLAALLSGGAALAYELSWSRALVIPLGNSADATAAVLAGFMLGMAAGAGLGGERAERARSPLRTYAALELLLAAVACVAPGALRALGSVPPLARYPGAVLLVAAPCLAMGATFPLLVRGVVGDGEELARRVGLIYGANTLGAALGAAGTGFFGIAGFGVAGSSRAGAVASLLAATLALGVSAGAGRSRSSGSGPGRGEGTDREPRPSVAPALALFAAGLGGFVMLAAEVLWARVLTFVFGHDTYAFASLLVIVLLGLALGGALERAVARSEDRWVLGGLAALLGLALLGGYGCAAGLVVTGGRDPFGLDASGAWATSPWLELARELVLTPILVLPAAVAAGALLPAACLAYARGRTDPGRRVGLVVLVNGLGAVLGALAASAGLGVVLGIHDAFRLLGLLAAAGGAVLLGLGARRTRWGGASLPLVVVALALAVLPGERPRALLLAAVGPRHQRLLHYEEGRTGTVSVIVNDLNGEKQLVMNAVNEVTTRLVHDQSFALLGHLGPLLHPAPRKAVMICLGAGLSAGAALTHPLERLDVVDLSAAVAHGARHFAAENGGVLDSPRLHLHIDDGRRFLLDAREPYDVAIIDSTHPKAVDSWILYTREFYALVRERLAPGGIVVQWLPLHGMSEQEFAIVVRTFLAEFAGATLWANVGFETYGQVGYAKLVARRDGPLEVDVAALRRRLRSPPVRASLGPYGLGDVREILATYVGGPAELTEFTRGVPAQTDDHPLVAYITPWSRGRRMTPARLLAARGTLAPVSPGATADRLVPAPAPTLLAEPAPGRTASRVALAELFVRAGRLERARALDPEGPRLALYARQQATTEGYYRALAARYPDRPSVLFEAGTQLGTLGHAQAGLAVLERAHQLAPGDFRVSLHRALALRATGADAAALAQLEGLRRTSWGSALVHQNLAALLLDAGEPGVAAAHLQTALDLDPSDEAARLALAGARLREGGAATARDLAAAVVAVDPTSVGGWGVRASASLRLHDCAAAAAAALAALHLDPTDTDALLTLAAARECQDDRRGAEAAWSSALLVEPTCAEAHDRLGLLLVARGAVDAGIEQHLAALELEPSNADFAAHLGAALLRAGRPGEARGAFCLALRLDPRNAAARSALTALGDDGRCAVPSAGGSGRDPGEPAAR